MRTSLRHLALVISLVLILASLPALGQFKINTFDTAVADTSFTYVFNPSAMGTDPKAYHTASDDPSEKVEGAASLKSVWRVHTTESWGGNNMLSFLNPTPTDSSFYAKNYRALWGDSTYIDWGSGTHLSLWYNNAVPSNAAGNGVQMRFHIYEAGPSLDGTPSNYYTGTSSDYEDWYFQTPVPLNDATPGWHELIIPLVDEGLTNSPDANGFCLTSWSGNNRNEKIDWDKIIGYTIEWTAGKIPGDTASGTVYYDNLTLQGVGSKTGYEAFYRFNDYTKDTTDFNSGWNNGGLSRFDFYPETTDTLFGATVLGVDWAINVKEDWGGGCNKEYNLPAGTYMQDLSSKGYLELYAKVVQPLTSSSGTVDNKITLRFVLFDYSNGTKEEWYTVADIAIDSIGLARGWQMVKIPLEYIQSGAWGDLAKGRFNTPNGTQDGILAWDKIGGFKMEFSSSRDAGEPFAPDLVYSGKVLLSMVAPSGFRETDHTAPLPVTGVNAVPGTYSNLVTWSDVPNEPGSTYTVFAAEKPFTHTSDAGVENLPEFGLPLGTQLLTHLLRSPNTDQNVSLYYGVTAMDKVGNINEPTVAGPFTNLAKGVPTFSLTVPTNFAADGDLSEWTGITPFLLSVNPLTPTCHAAPNSVITDDADLKVNAYLAMDATNLYVAFDVDDDVVSFDTSAAASSWLQDAPDLFIGLYDWRGLRHSSYSHGTQPDYHLRFSANKVIVDNDGSATLVSPGANYIFAVKPITSGYVVEARIPWTAFKSMNAADSLFTPVEGMRIPIDFEINDNDTPGDNTAREGMMCYSNFNNDNSYASVWRWSYTWIGNKSSTNGVTAANTQVNEYRLLQNYPNPFNPSTVINYSLAKSGPVTLKVYDILGREVATLVNGEMQSPGQHQATFNVAKGAVASGVYFYTIESGNFRDVKKMMLLK
jgi:hypothetical protein